MDIERYATIFGNVYDMMLSRGLHPKHPTLSKEDHLIWWNDYSKRLIDTFGGDPMEKTELERKNAGFDLSNDLILHFVNDSGNDSVNDSGNGNNNFIETVTMVYFHVYDFKFCKDEIKYVYSKMVVDNCDSIILVVKPQVTVDVRKALEVMGPDNQIFMEDSLSRNPTKHVLVPKFEKLGDAEKHKIMTQYSVTETQLPAMLIDDPISRYYNYKLGNLIKISRNDGTIYYRIIIASSG
jgi:DNA-directed RNA polymerase subunit H (RpoH/RPB5)